MLRNKKQLNTLHYEKHRKRVYQNHYNRNSVYYINLLNLDIMDFIKNLYKIVKEKSGIPYYHWHGIIATLLTVAAMYNPIVAIMFFGSFWYLSREIRDVEKLHNWDMKKFDRKGLVYPIIYNVILICLVVLVLRGS